VGKSNSKRGSPTRGMAARWHHLLGIIRGAAPHFCGGLCVFRRFDKWPYEISDKAAKPGANSCFNTKCP